MRKAILALVAATALTVGSAASAAITVSGATGLNNPNPEAAGSVVTVGNTTTINFGQNPVTSPFSASFVINNDQPGLYSIQVGTSDPHAFFDTVMFNGVALTDLYNHQIYKLIPPINLGMGSYTFSLTGHTSDGGSFTGNATISAVPEAGTWAMMLVGFGAIGLTMRSRRRTALAQIA